METFNTNTEGNVTVGTSSTSVLSAKADRKFLFLCNDSNEVMYLSFGGTAVMNKGIRLSASGGSIMLDSDCIFIGAVTAICASGSKVLTYSEA